MRRKIQKLRELPIKERRAILHLSMVVLSLVVFGLWTLTLRHNLRQQETQLGLKRSTEPFIDFGGQLAGTYNAFSNSIKSKNEPSDSNNVIELKSTIENGER